MSDTTPTPDAPSSETSAGRGCRGAHADGKTCRGGRRRRWRLFAFLGVLALGALTLPRAFAHGHGGWSCGAHREITAEQAREHMGRMAEHALDEVDASDAQRAGVDAALDRAAPELVAFKGEADDLREAARDAVAADRLDRAELDGLRQDALELADRASLRAMDLFLEVANVLTPDQRRQLRERAGLTPESE